MKSTYLAIYNALSLVAWAVLLARTVTHLLTAYGGKAASDDGHYETTTLLPYVTVLQSLAGLEVLHAALGIVRSSAATTALQIGGRNLVIWTVARRFPDLVFGVERGRSGFLGCILAWAASDVLRYAFFVVSMSSSSPSSSGDGWVLGWLKWLRYTAFIILYPIGFLSEASLVYISLVEAQDISFIYRAYLFLGLLAYLPAGYILYTYMFSQRRRALRPRTGKTKASPKEANDGTRR